MASASINEPENKPPSAAVVCSPYFEDSPAKYLASPASTEIPASPLPSDPSCLNSETKFVAGGCAANGCVAAARDPMASNGLAELSLENIYKLAIKFFKENEGTTALQISESDRLKLIGITKPITPEIQKTHKSIEDNFFDVVGNCNTGREPWMSLDGLPNKDAMMEFIRSLTALCPSFTTYLNAHRVERRLPLGHENEEDGAEIYIDSTDMQTQPDDHVLTDEEKLKFQQLKERIREVLNKQTIIQFRQYVVQQIPDNKEQVVRAASL